MGHGRHCCSPGVLDQILGDKLMYAHARPLGVVETKAEYLGGLRTATQKYTAIERQSILVKIYGRAAVAHSKVRFTGMTDGRPFNEQLMMLHV